MPRLWNVTCSGCDFRQRVDSYGFYDYVPPNGRQIFVPQRLVWCGRCGGVCHGERLPDAGRVERWIDETPSRRRRHDFEALRELLLARRSPAKCLTCGSTGITPLPRIEDVAEGATAGHPGCAGAGCLHLRFGGYVSVFPGPPTLYSPEGDRLPEPEAA